MQQKIKEILDELIETVLNDVLILGGTPHPGVPHDPNPAIVSLRDEIIAMYKHHAGNNVWVKATTRLPGISAKVKWRIDGDEWETKETVLGMWYNTPNDFNKYEWFDEAPNEQPVEQKESGKFDSKWLIGRSEERYKELESYKWEWRSFYNGWIEGRSDAIESILKRTEQKDNDAIAVLRWLREEGWEPRNHTGWAKQADNESYYLTDKEIWNEYQKQNQ